MAPDGMLVLFAGVPVGTRVALDLSPVFLSGAQYTGTSGSRIADQALVVTKTVAGELEPRRALAAVGGMETRRGGAPGAGRRPLPGQDRRLPAADRPAADRRRRISPRDPEIGPLLGADGSLDARRGARPLRPAPAGPPSAT